MMFAVKYLLLLILGIFLCIAPCANANLQQKRMPPTHYFIFGDKFSGVKHLSEILNSTSPSIPLQECKTIEPNGGSIHNDQEKEFTWRYGFFSMNDLRNRLDCDADKTLFILVVRDVRSMMCSVAKRKFQIASVQKLKQMHLNALVVHRWENNDHLELNGNASSHYYKVYNYLKLRTQKLRTHYSILSRAKHGVVTKYEDVMNDPNSEVKNILRGRGLIIGATIEVASYHKRKNDEKACFNFFTPSLYSKTIKKINKRLENKIGYPLVVQGRTQIEQDGIFQDFWNLAMDLLWWIIVPTISTMFIFALYLSWREVNHQYLSYSKRKGHMLYNTTSSRYDSKDKPYDGRNDVLKKADWVEVMEHASGRMYYIHKHSGKIQRNRPAFYHQYSEIHSKLNDIRDHTKVTDLKHKIL